MSEMLLVRAIGLAVAVWSMWPVFIQIAAIARELETLNYLTLQMLK